MTTACAFQNPRRRFALVVCSALRCGPGLIQDPVPEEGPENLQARSERELKFLPDSLRQINISRAGGKSRVTRTGRGIKGPHTCSQYQRANTPPPPPPRRLLNPPSRRPSQEARPPPFPPRSSLTFFSFHSACPARALQMTQFFFVCFFSLGGSIGGDVPKTSQPPNVASVKTPPCVGSRSWTVAFDF